MNQSSSALLFPPHLSPAIPEPLSPIIPEPLSPVIPEWGYRESNLTFSAEAKVLKSKWIPAESMRE